MYRVTVQKPNGETTVVTRSEVWVRNWLERRGTHIYYVRKLNAGTFKKLTLVNVPKPGYKTIIEAIKS